MFRATKLENVEAATKAEEPEDIVETDSPTGNSETSWNRGYESYDCKIKS